MATSKVETATTPVVQTSPPLEPTSSSGTLAASTNAPVGESATPAVIAAVVEQKAITAGGLTFSADAQLLMSQLAATEDATAIGVLESVKAYMVAVAPGKVMNAVDGGRHQVLFYRSMQTAINLVDGNFQLLFATILKLVADNSGPAGVFGPTYFVRWSSTANLSPNDRNGFVRLCNLLMTTAVVSGRQQALAHVDLPRALEFGYTETGKRRVMAFYGK